MAYIEENSRAMNEIKGYIEDELRGEKITKKFTPYYEDDGFLYPISDNTRIKVYMGGWDHGVPGVVIEQYKDEKWEITHCPDGNIRETLNKFDEVIDKAEALDLEEKRREEARIQEELSWQAKVDNIKEQSAELASRVYEDYIFAPEKLSEDFDKVVKTRKDISSCSYHYGDKITQENFDILEKAKNNLTSYYEKVITREYEKIGEEMENQYENLLYNDKEAIDKVDKLEERYKKAVDTQEQLSYKGLAPEEVNEKVSEIVQKVIDERDDSKIILYAQQKMKEREEKIREYDDRYQGFER